MIVFDLICAPHRHHFEGWFASSADFEEQRGRGLVDCPQCGSAQVTKAPMAPAVPKKGNQVSTVPAAGQPLAAGAPPAAIDPAIVKLAELQAELLKQSKWVGGKFADVSRAMHYGEQDAALVHGQATPDEARALVEEGISVLPLPFPVAPPDKLN
ncbi:DUF1178 family protein [Novosphingobium sp.]|uniref:DUF1178 family protein n=1 Tax=Novosphingobium sp. TaxID=1874826 RepID=UPI002736067A|nr:DUF1178 family protein [Novosphingobium sp.]MDP3906018.1 DUF1178 family protein [Novosphingobium sp.]